MDFSSKLTSTVTYWSQSGTTPTGAPNFSSPTTVSGRKEQKTELFKDDANNEQVARATYYLLDDISPRGYIFEGTSTASDPLTIDGAEEIRDVQRIPSLNNTQYLTKVLV